MREAVYHQYANQLSDDHWWVAHRRGVFSYWLERSGVAADGSRAILELGSGVGTEFSFLNRYGAVTGVELNPVGLSYCQKRGYAKLINGNINDCEFGESLFDLVVDFHVLYHSWIEDPALVLRRLYASLRPGGYLVLTEPAFRILKRSHDDAVMAARRWNRRELTTLIEGAGFSVQRWSGMLVPVAPIALVLAGLDRFRAPAADIDELKGGSALAESVMRGLLWGERAVLRWIPIPFGTCWAILAQKPQS